MGESPFIIVEYMRRLYRPLPWHAFPLYPYMNRHKVDTMLKHRFAAACTKLVFIRAVQSFFVACTVELYVSQFQKRLQNPMELYTSVPKKTCRI